MDVASASASTVIGRCANANAHPISGGHSSSEDGQVLFSQQIPAHRPNLFAVTENSSRSLATVSHEIDSLPWVNQGNYATGFRFASRCVNRFRSSKMAINTDSPSSLGRLQDYFSPNSAMTATTLRLGSGGASFECSQRRGRIAVAWALDSQRGVERRWYGLLLAQDQVHDPAPSDMWARATAMSQNIGVKTTSTFK